MEGLTDRRQIGKMKYTVGNLRLRMRRKKNLTMTMTSWMWVWLWMMKAKIKIKTQKFHGEKEEARDDPEEQ